MAAVPEVLFVCTHNAGRSQMAAALLDHQAAGRVHVTSAGSQPADQLNPAVVAAMAEIGLDISRDFPKPLTTDKVQAADVVITMGCGDACPVYTGKRYLTWDLPDPAGLDLEAVRPIRDEIGHRVGQLLAELSANAHSSPGAPPQPNTHTGCSCTSRSILEPEAPPEAKQTSLCCQRCRVSPRWCRKILPRPRRTVRR